MRIVVDLPAPVRPDEPSHPTLGQVEVDLVDGSKVAEVLGQTGCSDRSHAYLPSHLELRSARRYEVRRRW